MPQMTRLTSKGIYTVKRQNNPCTIMPPKSEIVRRGGYKCRTLEMNLQLREQQLKTISHTYRLLYQNFRITANQKSTIDTQTRNLWITKNLIVNKCKIHHEEGHLTSFLECWSLLTSDSDFLSIKEFMIIIIKQCHCTKQFYNCIINNHFSPWYNVRSIMSCLSHHLEWCNAYIEESIRCNKLWGHIYIVTVF